MSKAWSHLPNAHHIDWVLKSVKENSKLWDTARDDFFEASKMKVSHSAVWNIAMASFRDTVWHEAQSATWVATRRPGAKRKVQSVAWNAIMVLIAYDDCDHFLTMSYEQLKVWATLSEDPRAILLLPMVYVKEKLNEQWLVTSAECTSY